jgi:hypothetical protein
VSPRCGSGDQAHRSARGAPQRRAGEDLAHASHALDNKAPISLVQQALGHGSLKTTSIYAHAKPGDSSALYL